MCQIYKVVQYLADNTNKVMDFVSSASVLATQCFYELESVANLREFKMQENRLFRFRDYLLKLYDSTTDVMKHRVNLLYLFIYEKIYKGDSMLKRLIEVNAHIVYGTVKYNGKCYTKFSIIDGLSPQELPLLYIIEGVKMVDFMEQDKYGSRSVVADFQPLWGKMIKYNGMHFSPSGDFGIYRKQMYKIIEERRCGI